MCPNKLAGYGCQIFNVRTDLDVCYIAHRGCTDTVSEYALKVDTGREVPCRTKDSNPR